ncbi:GTPase HflX, partial [Marine Group I thaumarchaeote]|nr:GTPase HflX [Marine Group I thaumarchaeote]
DLLKSGEIEQKIDILNLTENKKYISLSAKTGNNVSQLKELIRDIMKSQNSPKFEKNLLEGVEKAFGN